MHERSRERRKERTDPLERLLDAHLLSVHKAANSDLNGQVDVVAPDVLPQVHLSARLAHPDHALKVSDRDREGARGEGLPSEVGVETGELLLVEVVELGLDPVLGVFNILTEEVLGDDLEMASTKGGISQAIRSDRSTAKGRGQGEKRGEIKRN
jgi:hypothetical protein